MIETKVVNVVATGQLNQPIDFCKLAMYQEITHRTDLYKGHVAYFKTEEMTGKVSIFSSGKMISAGARSESQAFQELEVAMNFLVKRNLIEKVNLCPKTENLVAVANFNGTIDLEKFSEKLKVIYEPEQFPGAILRLEEPFKTSILIFSSGKTVITGLKSQTQIQPTIKILKRLIASNQ